MFISLWLAALLSVVVAYSFHSTSYAASQAESPLVVVDKGGDETDGDTSLGQTTLREAVDKAADGDTIVFAPALAGTTIGLAEPLSIGKQIFINGGGQIAISGNHEVGVLEVLPEASLFITGTRIIDGNTQDGGGLRIDPAAQVVISHSRLEGNGASATGGAISNQGSLKLWDTTLAHNSGGIGGALYNNGGTVEIRNTTFYSNTALASAGAIFNSGGMNIYNSTFSANRASRGGGIFNNTSGDLLLNHTTFSDNESPEGSALYNGGKLALYNSILANGGGGTDCFSHPSANLIGNIHTLIEDGSCKTGTVLFGYRSGDPLLESLADNGGSTQTHALRVASPALNTGEQASCPAADQRGVGRPIGAACDRGAYESTVDLKSELLVGLDRGVCHAQTSNINSVVRSRAVDINFAALDGPIIDLNLFPGQPPATDVHLLGRLNNVDVISTGNYIWSGYVDQKPGSYINLSVTNAGTELIGRIWTQEGTYEISPVPGSDYHCLTEISEDAFYPVEDSLIPPASTASRSSAAPYAATAAADDGSILDVLVVYTPQAKTEAGGEAAIQAQAQKFVDLANEVNLNSGISHRLVLVNASEVTYSRLTCAVGSTCHITDLERLTQNGDGFLDDVHQLRDTYHADMVMLIVRDAGDYSTGGMAWVAASAPAEADDEASAFGLGVLGCAKGLCFVHEAGHIRGLNHDWYQSDRKIPFAWGHGYINPTAQYRTVMAYTNYCTANAFNCPMIPYFSNPDLLVNGAPAGVPSGSGTNCTKGQNNPNPLSCAADGRQVLNDTDTAISQYRSSQNVWTGNANSDWANPANWRMSEGPATSPTNVSRTPRTIDDILIPSTPAGGRFPVISGNVTMRNLTIENGATLTQSGGDLEVRGLWEEQGTGKFTATGGTVRFAGRLAQTIKMNAGSNLPGVIIETQGAGSVILGSDLQINGDLTLQAGADLNLGSGGYSVRLTGDWVDNGVTVQAGNSQVIMAGQIQSIDKATLATILSEDFNQFTTCCISSVPTGWQVDGAAFYQGPIFGLPSPTANRWETKADGWLFSPPLPLNTDTLYQLEYKVATHGGTQQVSVALGSQQNVGAMTQNLDATTLDNTALVSRTVNFTVSGNGSYYLGFRAQQSGGGFTIFDDVIVRSIQKISFFDLAIQSGNTAVLKNLAVGNSLSIAAGTTLSLPADTTVDGIVTNNGTLRQVLTVAGGKTSRFLTIPHRSNGSAQYYGVDITPDAAGPGSTSVEIRGNDTNCQSGYSLAHRCYQILPATPQTATVRFWYLNSESGGQSVAQMRPYRWNNSVWDILSAAPAPRGTEGVYEWVEVVGINATGAFALADSQPGFVPTDSIYLPYVDR